MVHEALQHAGDGLLREVLQDPGLGRFGNRSKVMFESGPCSSTDLASEREKDPKVETKPSRTIQGMTPSAPRVLKGFGWSLFAAGVFLKAKLNSHRASCGMLQTAPMQTQDCMGECLRMECKPSLAPYITHCFRISRP